MEMAKQNRIQLWLARKTSPEL